MTSLQKLVWLGLPGIALVQSTTGFVEFLAPRQNETILSDSTYTIRWAAKSSNGRGTMTLLGGQTSESLSKIWEIAYSIDIADGSFSWPVGFPTLAGSLSSFYDLNFSLDGTEGVFSISPLFYIEPMRDKVGVLIDKDDNRGSDKRSDDELDDKHHRDESGDTDENDENDRGNPHHSPSNSVTTTGADENDGNGFLRGDPRTTGADENDDNDRGDLRHSPSSQTSISITTTGAALPSSSGDGYVVNVTSSWYSSDTASPAQSPVPGPRVGNGAIAGIVIGATAALATFASLVVLVLYYRRRLSNSKISLKPEQNRDSNIDGKFRKAELDAEGSQVTITRVYELDATREVQEADGRMKPVELDSAVPSSELHAANVQVDSVLADGDSIIENEYSEH
ncbi:hypothetical protein F4860DRAFT_27177 [Xylaria cubensis]|nr:hypothetical protein F4860DRAFT_27177 [Xylaria cubensis]